jgi:hypothetical protein
MRTLVLAALRALLIARASLVAEKLAPEQSSEKDAPLGREVQGPELVAI